MLPFIWSESPHDDFIKWQNFPRYWPFARWIHRSPMDSSHKGQWRGVLMFSLIYAWTNGWANNRDADDLRRHRVNFDVTVLKYCQWLCLHQFIVIFLLICIWADIKIINFCRTFILTITITLTSQWLRWRLKSPASRWFTQPFIQT